jgi:hypothetical protein
MPEYTGKLNLTKLQDNEYYDGNVENENLDKIDEAIGNRVEKVDGKGLSSENYTAEEKQKLADVPDDLNTAYATKNHNHDGVYAPIAHNHNGAYEPPITKKSGFNLDKSDSVSSTSSVLLATAKAVKTAYDKAVSALSIANTAQSTADGKEPAFSKKSGFNLDKSNSVSSTSSSTLATSSAARTAYNKGVEALNMANTKTKVAVSTTAPAVAVDGDLWINPNA